MHPCQEAAPRVSSPIVGWLPAASAGYPAICVSSELVRASGRDDEFLRDRLCARVIQSELDQHK